MTAWRVNEAKFGMGEGHVGVELITGDELPAERVVGYSLVMMLVGLKVSNSLVGNFVRKLSTGVAVPEGTLVRLPAPTVGIKE